MIDESTTITFSKVNRASSNNFFDFLLMGSLFRLLKEGWPLNTVTIEVHQRKLL